MFGTANRRTSSTAASTPISDSIEAARAPERQPLQRPADHPGPIVGQRAALPATESKPRALATPGGGRLSVGRDIQLNGELKSCETLSVEGTVNLDLQDTKTLEVLEGGSFSGSAVVETAEIAGSFEGDLTVTGLLLIHPTGQVKGNTSAAELQIERGGMVCGDLQMTPPNKNLEHRARVSSKSQNSPD